MDDPLDAPPGKIADQLRAHNEAIMLALEVMQRQDASLRDQRSAIDSTLRDMNQQGSALLEQGKALVTMAQQLTLLHALVTRSLHPFVADGIVYPPAGMLADQRDDDYLRSNPYYCEPDVIERFERDRLPVPPPQNNEGYAKPDELMWYWVWGLNNYMKVMKATLDFEVDAKRVFDFGGSTGRIARHFYVQDEPRDVWWSDFNLASVQWCLQNFPADMRVFLNTVNPHLPIPDGYFDLITAFSVFTHIDHLETAWLLELKRILRPGGMLYATIHDEHSWRRSVPDGGLGLAVLQSAGGAGARFDLPMPAPRLAFPFTNTSHYNCNVFHSGDYVRTNWGRFFEIAEIIPEDHNYQAVVVAINR